MTVTCAENLNDKEESREKSESIEEDDIAYRLTMADGKRDSGYGSQGQIKIKGKLNKIENMSENC